ncbi:DNA-binding protein [Salibacterium salarium]|uniref:DNA-binding protein n=1 Tax=Salibacterium salarium TaxID=284579 RepID=A0A3R9PFQ2_9BACI|nr:helix-turn-helix domain-containing protein [Salibacterium salarium]RSL29686.1 DNA-binding protein [Salibacterium salarium]
MTVERKTLKADEVATHLGISLDLVYRLARQGHIPSVKIGKRVLFRKEAIDAWLLQNETGLK